MSGWLPFSGDIDEIANFLDYQEGKDDFFSTNEGMEDGDNDSFLQTIHFVRDILSVEGDKVTTSSCDSTCFHTPIFLAHG